MNFGEAIKCMKKGKKVTRNVWKENFFNGRKQFIFIGRNKGLTTKTFLAILPEEECFSDCIMSYTRKGSFQPNWTPTQEDMLAEDWEMYPAEETVVDETPNMTADSDRRIGNLYVLHAKYNKISEQYMYEPMLAFMRKDITFEKIGDEVHVEATFPIEMNREKAEKIMRDELAKWKARQEDLL